MSTIGNAEFNKVQDRYKVTIPKKFREDLDIIEGQYVKVSKEGSRIIIEKP